MSHRKQRIKVNDASGFYLSFWSPVVKIYPVTTLCWVNKYESIHQHKFCKPTGQYIFHSHKKQFFSLNYSFSGPNNMYLFEFNNNNSRIKCEICLKLTLTTEAADVILVSIFLTLNLFNTLFQCFFLLTWICKCQMEYFIALT